VIDYLEATLLLLPPEAGGRSTPVAPREGSYCPFVEMDEQIHRARVIEGPPLLAPGDEGRVVIEIESDAGTRVHAGAEMRLLERNERFVGLLTVMRVCRGALILPLLLFAASCASSSDFGMPTDRVIACDTEIEIRAGFQAPGTQIERDFSDRVTTLIDVSNNSHRDIIVKWIRVEQMHTDTAPYQLGNGYRTFNQPIAEAEDHQFELPMTGRGTRDVTGRSRQSNSLMLGVTVALESGEQLRCHFSVPAPL